MLLFLTLIWAAVLRFYNNTSVSLWHDEAFSALYINYSWSEMWDRIVLDVHPPLYYYILRFWSYIFGDSLLSLRGMSILFGVLTVWAGYAFVKKAFGNKTYALLAAFLIAINPFQIQYALEARMYTLGTFLVMFSSYWLVRALESKSKKHWLFYGFTVAAMLYTHYYLIFSVAGQALYALFAIYKRGEWKTGIRDNQLLNLVMAGVFSIILYLPWLPPFLEQLSRVQGGYWIPPMDRWAIPGTIWKIALGGQYISHNTLLVGCAVAAIAIFYFLKKVKDTPKWLVFFGLSIPFLAAILLSIKNDIYLDRYFVFASLSFSILIAGSLLAITKPWLKRSLIVLFIVISFAAFVKNWSQLDVKDPNTDIVKKPGMAAASAYLTERTGSNDRIYVGSSLIFFTFKYYNETGITPKLLSSIPLEQIPHYSGTAIMTEEDLLLESEMFNASNYKTNEIIWLLWTTGWGGNKPNVPGNWSKVSEFSWRDTPDFKGELYVTQYRVN